MKRAIAILFAAVLGTSAQDTRYPPEASQIPGPGSGEHDAWLNDLRQWRHERLIRMGYDGAEYGRPELLWTQRNFIQPQMMAEERYFYDPASGKYTVGR
jgi:iron(II)-dependent oxidoreductase